MMKRNFLVLLVLVITLCGCAGNSDQSFGPFTQDILRVELEIGGAEVLITRGDVLLVETDNPYITAEERSGTLKIEERSHIADLDSSTVTIYIPKELVFEDVDISTGAGRLQLDALACRQLELELGAGLAEIYDLTVEHSASIDGGAGKIVLHNGDLNRLDFDMGVGEADIVTALSGDSEISAGVGALYLTVLGDMADFTVDAQGGIGKVEVENTSVTLHETIGSGSTRLEIEGGVGSITVDFEP